VILRIRKDYIFKGCGVFIRHSLFLIVLLFWGLLYADVDVIGKGEFLSGKLIETLSELDIPENSSIHLNFWGHETHDLNRYILQEVLLNNNFTVVESEEFADLSILIRAEEREVRDRRLRRNNRKLETIFLVHITRVEDTHVLAINRFSFLEPLQEELLINNKWYSPFLITFVIGSLIYLLYFGM
jgi:hypothetical protein